MSSPMSLLTLAPLMNKPDPEVPSKPSKRIFTAEFKLRVLEAVDAAKPGEIGAILRREGLYASHLTTWRRQRDEGDLASNARSKKGRPLNNPLIAENERLRREAERLTEKLRKAELIIEVQKKMALLLDSLPLSEEPRKSSKRRK